MRGIDKSNRIESAKLYKDLEVLTNLTPRQTDGFISIILDVLIHKVAMQAVDASDRISVIEIEIPRIGLLTCLMDKETKEIEVESIALEDEFKNSIASAVNNGDSPLINRTKKALINQIKNRYDSLV